MSPDIYSYVRAEENRFRTDEVQVGDNWTWNFRNHVQLIFHLKNGVFYTGENDWMRAFRNIMEPILSLSYWTEDIEVKDVVFFIEGDKGKALSFLVKKYHDEVYTRKHDLDTLFDEITESDVDYGGVVVQKGSETPEVLPLNSIAFCDQTDLMGGPIATKHYFDPDRLREMSKKGWGDKSKGATVSLDDLCTLATADKETQGLLNEKKNLVTGKTIEVYILRGNLPSHYLNGDDNMEDWFGQVHVIAFYTDKDKKKQGVTLYRAKEEESNLKFFTSKKVYQRALGRGVGEGLLHPQIWTNFLTIHKTNMLAAASKVPLQTDDANFTTRNKVQDMENLEVTVLEDGKSISQIPTAAPANIQLFSNEINSWYDAAQLSGSAFDPLMGKEAPSGSTFRGQERVVAQGKGPHDKRRGQRAKFIEELYRDWIIPDMVKEILNGSEFLADLSSEELMWINDRMSDAAVDDRISQAILAGHTVSEDAKQTLKEFYRNELNRAGSRRLVKILEDEFSGVEVRMGIDVAGKQKDLAALSDKLLSIFQFVFANPAGFQQAMQVPALARSFENILEFGGMSIGDFSTLLTAPQQQAQPVQSPMQGAPQQPQQQLTMGAPAQ